MKQRKLLIAVLVAWMGIGSASALSQVDGVYQIASAADLTEFSSLVTNGTTAADAVLTADIDLASVDNFQPIGFIANGTSKAYTGTFDGQGHRLKNLTVNYPEVYHWGVGLFSRLGGGAVVKNLTLDATCRITGGENVGGIAGVAVTGNGGDIIIENCGVEGSVTCVTTGTWYWNQRVAAILGCCSHQGTEFPDRVVIRHCYNTGTVSGTTDRTAALCAYANGKVVAENCYNAGTVSINGTATGQFIYESGGSVVTNCYTTTDTEVASVTAAQVASGELCFLVNGSQSGDGVPFRQNLTGSADAHPVLDASHAIVYAVGDLNCDGTAKGTISYNNVGGDGTRDPHIFDNGICTVCGTYEEPELVDGIYQIASCGQLVRFGELIKGDATLNAVLTADIDLSPVSNFTPLGFGFGYTSAYYTGTFDGQGHRISHLVINRTTDSDWGIGLFSMLGAGAVIRNVIIDATCSITGRNYVGGIAGSAKGAGNVTIENCGNEGTVACSGVDGWYWNLRAAGIIGSADGRDGAGLMPAIVIRNCYNTGAISGTLRTAALCAGAFGNVAAENCYNTGTIADNSAGNHGQLLYDNQGSTLTNCYATTGTQATMVTDAQVGSGELCCLLNKTGNGGTPWLQDIDNGGSQTAHPVPCGTAGRVWTFADSYTNTEAVTLDEAVGYDPVAAPVSVPVNVNVIYTFVEGWNPLVLPFATTAATLKSVLGADEVKAFTSVTKTTDDKAILNFSDAADVAAATPVMVKMPAGAPSSFAFANVALTTDDAPVVTQTDGAVAYDFVGNYTANLDLTDQAFYVVRGTTAIYSQEGQRASAKAFRAYFVNKSAEGGEAKFAFLEESTGIESLTPDPSPKGEGSKYVYDLQGRKVNVNVNGNSSRKGIYIVNGKKIVIK